MLSEALSMAAIKPVIDSFITNVIAPKLNSFAELCHLKYNELLIPREEHFQEYLFRTYKKYSIINTLVLKNEQRLLKDLYIPLSICKENLHSKESEKTKIEGYPIALMNEYSKILITDTAGMGKSTLAKRIYLDIVEKGYGIPLYIEMRRLNKERLILSEIKGQIDSLSKEFDLKLLYTFIQTGGFIFILDGYDEISFGDRAVVTANLQDFISKAGNNKFILTSRPEEHLAGFGDFQRFKINSLNKNEAYELLRKYDAQGETSRLLISELKTGKYEMINEFLKNPLLVSLLFAAFDYKQTIPLKKHIFYRQVYDAYFDSHDLSKGDGYIHEKQSKLDIDDFDRVLRHVGYRCLKCQKIEFDKVSLLKIIDDAKSDCVDLNFTSSDFFHDLLNAVPLFCNDGQYYKWVHKSIQEYFAAQFIYRDAKENQDMKLTEMNDSDNLEKYINLLDFYYDIDKWGFMKNIVKLMCKEYCNYYEHSIFDSHDIDSNDIDDRIGSLFKREVCMFRHKLTQEEFVNPFCNVRNMINAYLRKRPNLTALFHESSVYVVNYIYPYRALMKLVHDKLPDLFKPKASIAMDDDINLDYEKIYKIDLHSFEFDKTTYKLINQYLQGGGSSLYILKYNACKEEINKIDLILNKKSCTSSIVDGL